MAKCTYCGCPHGDTLDHVIPQSEQPGQDFSRKYVVPACNDCNGTLGSRPYYTIGSRALYLKAVFEKRWKPALKGPTWSAEELEELGYHLRRTIETKMKLRAEYKRALEHLEFVGMVSPSIKEVWDDIDDQETA